jgi:hypothetical protein
MVTESIALAISGRASSRAFPVLGAPGVAGGAGRARAPRSGRKQADARGPDARRAAKSATQKPP